MTKVDRAFAGLICGVSRQAIAKWVKTGRVKEVDGYLSLEECIKVMPPSVDPDILINMVEKGRWTTSRGKPRLVLMPDDLSLLEKAKIKRKTGRPEDSPETKDLKKILKAAPKDVKEAAEAAVIAASKGDETDSTVSEAAEHYSKFQKLRAEEKRLIVEEKERKAEIAKGNLIDRTQAELQIETIGTEMAAGLSNFAPRLANALLGKQGYEEFYAVIVQEVDTMMEDISKKLKGALDDGDD